MAKKSETKLPISEINKSKKGLFSHIGIIKNLIFLFVMGLVWLMILKGNEGYQWMWNDLLAENLKFIEKYPSITENQKYESKFGIDAFVIQQIKKSTPEDAIILMPPNEVIISDDSEYQFMKGQGGLKSRNWMLYFLYPRKLVYADETDKLTDWAKNATHIVCLNGWGYEKLNYEVTQKQTFQILALSK